MLIITHSYFSISILHFKFLNAEMPQAPHYANQSKVDAIDGNTCFFCQLNNWN